MNMQEFRSFIGQLEEYSRLDLDALSNALRAIDATKLSLSSDVVGCVDKAILKDDGKLEVSGWAFDKANSSDPVTVLIFYPGSAVLSQKTMGRRADILAHFPDIRPQHVNFGQKINRSEPLSPDSKVVVIAIGPTGSVGLVDNTKVVDFRDGGMGRLVERGYDTGNFSEVCRASKALTVHEKTFLDEFISLLPSQCNVLDAACGSGVPYDKYLIQRGCKVTGIDISTKQISLARQNVPEGIYLKQNVIDINCEMRFDGLISLFAIFHIPRSQHKDLFLKLRNIINDKGAMLLTLPTCEMEFVSNHWGADLAWSSFKPSFYFTILKSLGFYVIRSRVAGNLGDRHLWLLAQKL